jgi:hypothetical protein
MLVAAVSTLLSVGPSLEVNSPVLKVLLDAPIMPVKTPEAIRKAAHDVCPLQVLSHFGGDYTRGTDGK